MQTPVEMICQRSVVVSLLSITCAGALPGCVEADGPRTVPVERPVASQPSAGRIAIRIARSAGYSDEDRRKLDEAAQVAAEVINSDEFRERVLTYGSGRSAAGFSQAARAFSSRAVISNQEVLDALLAGNAPADGTIRLFLSAETNSSEVGHTRPVPTMDGTTFTDRAKLRSMGVADLADHLIHEHMHRIGFLHHKHYSVERCDSIPYAVGHLVCTIARDRFHTPGACTVTANRKC